MPKRTERRAREGAPGIVRRRGGGRTSTGHGSGSTSARTTSAIGLGKPAEAHVLALPGRSLRRHVAEIGAEGDFALNRDVKRGTPDLRTFMVRVALDAPQGGSFPA